MRTALSPASGATVWNSSSAVRLTPPADPTMSSPCVSLSRLSKMSPLSSPSSMWSTPYMVVSSSAVMKASRGPWQRLSSSKMAIIVATAIPSSAPSVVLRARTHSPSIHVSMGSVSKLCCESGVFCGTMSMCPCNVTTLRSSIPGDAALYIRTLPALSRRDSMWCSFAQLSKNCCIFSRCPEGRGT